MPALQTGITTTASGQILTAKDFLVADGFPGSPFTFNPDPGATPATATITVTTAVGVPVGLGNIIIGLPGFSGTLVAAAATVPGANNFNRAAGTAALIAIEIAAAINDATNVFAEIPGVTAIAVGAVVTLTVSTAGIYGNNFTIVSGCSGVTISTFTGGANFSVAGASAGWFLRGLMSVNVENLRSIYIQLYHYTYYYQVASTLAVGSRVVRIPAREYLTWRPVGRSAPIVNQGSTAWPYEPATDWFPLAPPQLCPIGVPISTRLDVGGMSEVSIEISENTFPNQTIITGGMGVAPWPTTGAVFPGTDRFRLVITAAS